MSLPPNQAHITQGLAMPKQLRASKTLKAHTAHPQGIALIIRQLAQSPPRPTQIPNPPPPPKK